MNEEDLRQEKEALDFMKKNHKDLVAHFCGHITQLDSRPTSIFMAGSPGAGKTEFSKGLLMGLEEAGLSKVIRIDPDEVRAYIPGYNGKNATLFQKAATIGVEKIHDHVLHKGKNFLLDTTLSDYEKARKNVIRSLSHGRFVSIQYLYQDPVIAWDFTKKREKIEKRGIPVEFFIESFLSAKETANKLKKEFGRQLIVNLFVRDYTNDKSDTKLNIDNIDNHLKVEYTKDDLKKILC